MVESLTRVIRSPSFGNDCLEKRRSQIDRCWKDFRKDATTQDRWTALLEEEAHIPEIVTMFSALRRNLDSFRTCVRACRVRRVVEFGASFGVSTIHLACALSDSGDGLLIGTELNP